MTSTSPRAKEASESCDRLSLNRERNSRVVSPTRCTLTFSERIRRSSQAATSSGDGRLPTGSGTGYSARNKYEPTRGPPNGWRLTYAALASGRDDTIDGALLHVGAQKECSPKLDHFGWHVTLAWRHDSILLLTFRTFDNFSRADPLSVI